MENKITYPVDSKVLTKEFVYHHCAARGESLKSLDDGAKILVKSVCAYDTDDGNKIISILGFKWDTEKQEYAKTVSHFVSNSSIFRSDFQKIVEIFGDTDIEIIICKNVSKAGRTFVTCALA